MADKRGITNTHPNLPAGEKILIQEGPLAGLSGMIANPPKNEKRVQLLVQLLGRETKVTLPLRSVTNQWRYRIAKN